MRFSRRAFLALGASGVLGLTGCVGDGGGRSATTTRSSDPSTTTVRRDPARFETPDRCSATFADPGAGPLTVERNPRERLWCRGRPIEQFEDATGWGRWGGEARIVDGGAVDGTRSVRIAADESDLRCGVVLEFEDGADLSGYDVSVGARLGTPPQDGVIVQLLAPDHENYVQSTRYGYEAGWIRLDHGPRTVRGDPDPTDVRAVRIGTYVGEGKTAEMALDGVRGIGRRDRGIVTFTFDDNDRSHYDTAFPIMEEYGFPGAVAVIPHTTDWNSKVGVDGLREMQAAGWEVVSHPQRDRSLRALPSSEAERAIVETKQWLLDHGFGTGADYIVWPFGQYDADSLSAAGRYHHLGFTTAQGIAGRVTDPLLIPRVDGARVAFAKRMVEFAERYGGLCVLEYHDVGSDGVPEEAFREVLDRVESAAVDVLTLSELHSRVFR